MRRSISVLTLSFLLAAAVPGNAAAASSPAPGQGFGARVSGGVRYAVTNRTAPAVPPGFVACSTPGQGNYKMNCKGSGFPVNETSIAYNGTFYVAGANDYNSYNLEGQAGFYASVDGKTWYDGGPIDIFPHALLNAVSDPSIAIDANNVVYDSSVFFNGGVQILPNASNCSVGGLQLMRRDPATGGWSSYQIAANSLASFQDKPWLMMDGSHVFVSWTSFASCTGQNVASPIMVAELPTGSASVAPITILSVPGSTFSQGSNLVSDGAGGFWIAWEEFPNASETIGSIKVAHWSAASGWNTPQTVSPPAFKDLPATLPGFKFRTNSFPSITMLPFGPAVVWASADSGVGRVYGWAAGLGVRTISDSGGDQFFPVIRPVGIAPGVFVTFSQTDSAAQTYDQYLAELSGAGTTVTKVSTASSHPNSDVLLLGKFIGDYSGMTVTAGVAHPSWTDIRAPGSVGYEMDAFTAF